MLVKAIDTTNFKQNTTPKNKHKPNTVKITGYACLATGLGSVASAKSKNLKLHKFLGYSSGTLALLHTGLVEYYHHKFKKGNN